MIEIDGSFLEGGGQILRVATALATITKIPCRVFNIRKKRPNPGLQTQHLLSLQALSKISDGKLEGDFLGSTEILFEPGEIKKEKISIKIPTAASITLILQSLIPVSLFAKNPLEINFEGGATDTFFSPTLDYFQFVFLKILEKMGAKFEIKIEKRGYYPEGGAKMKIKIFPQKLSPIILRERGEIKKIYIFSRASESLKQKKVAERQIRGVLNIFQGLNLPIQKEIEYLKTDCPGSSILVLAEFENTILGSDNLGKLGKKAEDVGKEAAIELLKEERSGGCLDKFMGDQILPYLALTGKKSQVVVSKITDHLKTNIWVIEKFLAGKFEIEGNLISWIPK